MYKIQRLHFRAGTAPPTTISPKCQPGGEICISEHITADRSMSEAEDQRSHHMAAGGKQKSSGQCSQPLTGLWSSLTLGPRPLRPRLGAWASLCQFPRTHASARVITTSLTTHWEVPASGWGGSPEALEEAVNGLTHEPSGSRARLISSVSNSS